MVVYGLLQLLSPHGLRTFAVAPAVFWQPSPGPLLLDLGGRHGDTSWLSQREFCGNLAGLQPRPELPWPFAKGAGQSSWDCLEKSEGWAFSLGLSQACQSWALWQEAWAVLASLFQPLPIAP